MKPSSKLFSRYSQTLATASSKPNLLILHETIPTRAWNLLLLPELLPELRLRFGQFHFSDNPYDQTYRNETKISPRDYIKKDQEIFNTLRKHQLSVPDLRKKFSDPKNLEGALKLHGLKEEEVPQLSHAINWATKYLDLPKILYHELLANNFEVSALTSTKSEKDFEQSFLQAIKSTENPQIFFLNLNLFYQAFQTHDPKIQNELSKLCDKSLTVHVHSNLAYDGPTGHRLKTGEHDLPVKIEVIDLGGPYFSDDPTQLRKAGKQVIELVDNFGSDKSKTR